MKPKRFENQNLLLRTISISVILTVPVTQARETAQDMQEELESLAVQVGAASSLSIPAAQRLSKEVGLLMNVRNSP